MSKRDEILPLFPLKVRDLLSAAEIDFDKLSEIRLRVNQPVMLRTGQGGEMFLAERAKAPLRVTAQDIRDTVELISRHSLYAFEEDVKRGFLTVPGGHRVGIAGRVVLDGERVAALRNISFLNIRVSHEVRGCAEEFLPYIIKRTVMNCSSATPYGCDSPEDDYGHRTRRQGVTPCGCDFSEQRRKSNADGGIVTEGKKNLSDTCHTLILSGPGGGKTTLLRDLVRLLSYAGKNVSVIDERSEIAACYQGVPENDLGPRTDVLDGCPKAVGCRMALRSLAPDILAVDELGGREDLEALSEVTACGCRILATIHANGLEDLRAKPLFKEMREQKTFERFLVRIPAVPVGHRGAWRVADEAGAWIL
ncbi:MAG: Flp pilus assembly complex ATPase component TadA [Lachnospiraceae bacterium]|nr:Flp pilus assembly complex ATPase component TadA [Lachnospiraceae bacterium]